MAFSISADNRVVITILKLVLIDRYAFGGCGNQAFIVRIDKPSGFGIIVSALEVVQSRFGIIDIPTVAEGVELTQRAGHSAGGGQRIAPRVIGVRHHLRAAAVIDVAVTELLLEQLNPIKVYLIYVVAVK